MKKIIYLISSLKGNGPNRVLLSMLEGIDKTKYDVYIISFLNDNDLNYLEIIKKKVNNVYLLNLSKKHHIITKGRKSVQSIVDTIYPDIIHSHGTLPDIVNAKIKTKSKKITTIHDNMFEDYLYHFGYIKGKLIIKWHLYYLKRFYKCICCSSSSYEILKRHLKNTTFIRNAIYKKERSIVEYNKVRNKIRAKYNINKDDIIYLFAGNLTKLKNVIQMVEKFNNNLNKNEFLLILGSGEMEVLLKKTIKDKHIIFIGYTNKVNEYMCASDIYVSFSLSEGFSISILEALENDNYLLISDIPSHKEVLTIDENYYIGEYFNSDNFVNKKNNIIKHIKNKKSNDSLIFLKKYLTINNMMKKYELFYDKQIIKEGEKTWS
ncbi:MAG: glycosyltransferase family 4 protein [Bacilli bacterium]|nr:glycosyltransferase family 4 protein [Bacilli bacterium]